MKITFTGSVHFANGDPISNVEVRIFDKDAEGKQDDDLTITPGLSNEQGDFNLTYEPLRYLDYHILHLPGASSPSTAAQRESAGLPLPDLSDIYLPYLEFNYTLNGLNYLHTASLGPFQTSFYLPENPPLDFLPSVHGFKFLNNFHGYFLPFSTPAWMGSRKVSSQYGLCGGMCAAAYDFTLANKPIPSQHEVPKQGTRLQRYLFRRQLDSLGGLGQEVVKVAHWTTLPDGTPVGTWRRSADEFNHIRRKLDQHNLVVLALIYEHATSLGELSRLIFNNHQVLAYAYQPDAANGYTIQIYDPNLPGRDDVTLKIETMELVEDETITEHQPLVVMKTVQMLAGSRYRDVRGFFAMPYSPVIPPKGI